MPIDITEDLKPTGSLPVVVRNAQKLVKLDEEIEQLQLKIGQLESQRQELASKVLPDLMDASNVSSLSLSNGCILELKEIFSASLPAQSTIEKADEETRVLLLHRWEEGVKWLKENKALDILKSTIKIQLGRKQQAYLKQFAALAKRLKIPINSALTVHPATLASVLKEKMAQGATVPMDIFGIYQGREAIIKMPKQKKPTKG